MFQTNVKVCLKLFLKDEVVKKILLSLWALGLVVSANAGMANEDLLGLATAGKSAGQGLELSKKDLDSVEGGYWRIPSGNSYSTRFGYVSGNRVIPTRSTSRTRITRNSRWSPFSSLPAYYNPYYNRFRGFSSH